MKKIYLVLALLFVAFTGVFAQDATDDTETVETIKKEKVVNAKGESMLPQAGDIAIGADLSPFMNYIGNAFNGTQNNTFGGNFLGSYNTLFLKYFLTDESAVRVSFRFETDNVDDDRYIRDDAAFYADPLSNARVVDRMNTLSRDFGLSVGYEMHRGRGKLKGIYGVDAAFYTGSSVNSYTYGNTMTDLNQAPSTTNFGGNINGNNRVLTDDNGGWFGIGAEAFVGVEYFFMPNICIGSEVSWGAFYSSSAQSSQVEEYWDGVEVKQMTTVSAPKGDVQFSTGMHNPSVLFYMMFHF